MKIQVLKYLCIKLSELRYMIMIVINSDNKPWL